MTAVLVVTFAVLVARMALLLAASASPSSPGVEADGAPAGHRLPAGATTKDPS